MTDTTVTVLAFVFGAITGILSLGFFAYAYVGESDSEELINRLEVLEHNVDTLMDLEMARGKDGKK